MLNHVKPISTGRPPKPTFHEEHARRTKWQPQTESAIQWIQTWHQFQRQRSHDVGQLTIQKALHLLQRVERPLRPLTAWAAWALRMALWRHRGHGREFARSSLQTSPVCYILLPSANLKILALSQKETGKYWVTGRFLYFVDLVISARARCWERPRPGCSSRKLAALYVSRKWWVPY